MTILKHHQLYANKGKCSFGANHVKYLGHIISRGFVSVYPSKVERVLNWPRPTSVNELRGFLGLSGYYRRFIR